MEKIEYIIGNEERLDKICGVKAWKPFDDRIINICNDLSENLMNNKGNRNYPDLVTLAFWLRRSNLQKIRKTYDKMDNNLGVGLVFHIAPGNIALSFAYSMITGLLTGNTNIVRLPSRNFVQVELFCKGLSEELKDEPEIEERICLIKYPHDKDITDWISSKCHMRVIWGGDNTVDTIRQSPIPPRATEITFANRFSICIIDADAYLNDYKPEKTAHDFYIDTYLTDQNACSSPRFVFWMGNRISEAQEVFWNALYSEIKNYNLAPVTSVDKLITFCKYAAEHKCNMIMERDCRIMRIGIEETDSAIIDNIGNSGLFYECCILDMKDILPICTWQLQTISYIGIDPKQLRDVVLDNAPEGVDRIVPVGHTMDFSFVWDGKDIVRSMTRQVSL